MPDRMPRFHQARLKHEWANQLHAVWQRFLESDFCQLTVEPDPEGGECLRVASLKALPAELVLCLGDVVHNLRCALDYTISEILCWKDTRVTFPMHEKREELVASFRTEPETMAGRTYRKGGNAAVEVAVPGIGAFIADEIRPYKSADGFLWPLGKLDARDKHRLLIPILVPQTINGINAVDGKNNRIVDCSVTIGPGRVASFARFGAGAVKIESYGKPTAQIFFNERGFVQGQAVFPTLVNMSQAVSETIDRVDEFLTGVGWKPDA